MRVIAHWDGLEVDGRLLPWPLVRRVQFTPDGGLVTTDEGVVAVNSATAQRVAALLTLPLTAEGADDPCHADGTLKLAAIESWLGVRPGGSVVSQVSPLLWAGVALLLLFVAAMCAMMPSESDGWVALWFPIVVVVPVVKLARSVRRLRADAQGLSVVYRSQAAHYAWSEVVGLRKGRDDWEIETVRGPLPLSGSARNATHIAAVIYRVLLARDLGAVVPSEAPLPDGAISRMDGDAATGQERGLSQPAGKELL